MSTVSARLSTPVVPKRMRFRARKYVPESSRQALIINQTKFFPRSHPRRNVDMHALCSRNHQAHVVIRDS